MTFHIGDGLEFLSKIQDERFDLIFADSWQGKFDGLELALSVLKIGKSYVVDDLSPQSNWLEDHQPKIPKLVDMLAQRADLAICPMEWSSEPLVSAKKGSLME